MKCPLQCSVPLNGFCAQLCPETRFKLCGLANTVRYDRHRRLYVSGYGKHFLVLQQGFGTQNAILKGGRQVAVRFCGKGDMLGSVYMFGNPPLEGDKRDQFFDVIQPVVGCIFDLTAIEELFMEDADFARNVQKHTALALMQQTQHLVHMESLNSEEKIRYLQSILARHDLSLNDVTHEEIALLLNMNRVTVTKTIKNIY